MARAGDTLKLGEDRLTFLTTARDTGGAHVEVEVEYAPAVTRPPVHYHPRQREHMRLVDGELRVDLDGRPRAYGPGEEFHVPSGVPHTLWNPGPGRTTVVWRTAPALDTEKVFETLWGLADEGRIATGKPLLHTALLALRFRNEYRLVTGRPFALDMAMCGLLAPLGLACGYRPTYRPPHLTAR
ncbi:cupin domain-containing protein [Streptomyces sp. SID8352]|uniref:cupin domain-containing protein n=1 Tax=Streptomyces sp. SID8352 TaxID=2690338 RepID=UPI00136AD39D|nr:cupin domain-containing protein [Streptomyces sp. SID8352]MYU20818.1 cupin domain-containing protein [Streptomyces sp. SID8352]